jgi:hypothetical protein
MEINMSFTASEISGIARQAQASRFPVIIAEIDRSIQFAANHDRYTITTSPLTDDIVGDLRSRGFTIGKSSDGRVEISWACRPVSPLSTTTSPVNAYTMWTQAQSVHRNKVMFELQLIEGAIRDAASKGYNCRVVYIEYEENKGDLRRRGFELCKEGSDEGGDHYAVSWVV